jgi:Tfp pilus assembly major pilin PilA
MLLVVGTVVFVAGCAEKTNNAENENQAASGQNSCSNKRKYDWKHYSSNWNSYK